MSSVRTVLARLAGLVGRRRRDAELSEEIASHLELLAEAHRLRGLSEAEARAAARRDFGGVDQIKEVYRDARGWPWLDSLLQDVRYGLRTFHRDRTFSIVATATLALGIGATTTIVAGVKSVLFDSLPYPHADRIVTVTEIVDGSTRLAGTFGMYRGLAERVHAFETIAVMKPWQPTLTGGDRPERLEGQRVSARYFDVLGIVPALGRGFVPDDDRLGGPSVVVLSDRLWRRRFAGDPAVVGRTLTFDGRTHVVVGVAPADFENVLAPAAELWAPLQYDMSLGSAWGHHLRTIARLRPGVPLGEASLDVAASGRRVLDEFRPVSYARDVTFQVDALQGDIVRSVKPSLLAVLAAVALVLVIACVNVTGLLIARGAKRNAEFKMRLALGAGRMRLMRQLLTESLLLAIAGGAGGIVVAAFGVRGLVALTPPELPRAAAIGIDRGVLALAFGITSVVGLLVGAIPALQSSRVVTRQRGSGGAGRTIGRRSLVVAEVALAVVLLVSAGLLFRSLQRLFAVSPGFDPSRRITMQVQTSGSRFDKAATDRFFEHALASVRAVPGVSTAGFTSQLPLSGDDDEYGARFEEDPPNVASSVFRYGVSSEYVEAIGIPLRRGRLLDVRDSAASLPVALISESLARRKFGRADPIGRRAHLGPPTAPWYTIVGVVGDVRQMSLALTQPDAVYVPATQWPFADRVMSLVVKTQGDAALLAPAIRDAIWSVDRNQPVSRIATMDVLLSATAAARRFALVLFEAFAVAALTLAAIGIYGLLSGSVAERTHELAIRLALGASPARILCFVTGQGLALAVAGIVIGLAGAAAANGPLAALLFGVTRLDPLTYGAVATLLVAVATFASAAPAWRAAHVEPAVALKAE